MFLGLLVLFYFFDQGQAFGLDWHAAGLSRSEETAGSEPWRAITALFLHTGPVHLLSNVLFGALFGFLVATTHGGGLGWLAILAGGALGNLLNALFQDAGHLSVGASTAVFAAVGVLAGSEWRRRNLLRQRRLRRAAPVVMALLLLAFHGVPDDVTVDVLAHVLGVLCGLPIGALLPTLLARGALSRRRQILFGALALALIGAAWAAALLAEQPPG